MTCPDEPTLMLLADGELDAPVAAAVRAHASGCASCRAALTELRAERGLLVQTLHEGALDESSVAPDVVVSHAGAAAPGDRWWGLAPLTVAVSVVVAAVAWLVGAPTAWQLPPSLEWISPFHPSGRLPWLFAGMTLGAGVAFDGLPLTSMVTAAGQTVAALLLLLLVVPALSGSVRRAVLPALLAIVLAVAVPAEAFVSRSSEDDVVVPADEMVDDTLVARGERVLVDGVVTGDLIAGGQSVVIRGTVHGNVIAWAQSVDLSGDIGGSVFVSSQFVTVQGGVDGSFYTFSQATRLVEGGRVGGGVASFSNTLTIEGSVDRGVQAAGYRVDVTGAVQGNVYANARRVAIGPRSRIGGTLTARVPDTNVLQIDPAATLTAEPVVRSWDEEGSPSRYLTGSFYRGQSVWLVAVFLTGWLLLWAAPGAAAVQFGTPPAVLRTLGVGFLCVVATPVAALIAGLTLVGLPLALVALALWALGIYLAKIPIALFLGRTLLGPRGAGGPALALLVGLLAVFVAVNLPFVGWIVNLALTLIGVGGLFAWAVAAYRGSRGAPARA